MHNYFSRSLTIFSTIKATIDKVPIEDSLRKEDKVVSFHSNLDKSILKSDVPLKITATTKSDSSTIDGDAIVFPTENVRFYHFISVLAIIKKKLYVNNTVHLSSTFYEELQNIIVENLIP